MNGKTHNERRKNVKRSHKLRATETVKHNQHGKVKHNQHVQRLNCHMSLFSLTSQS
jgi:hypothetical protein